MPELTPEQQLRQECLHSVLEGYVGEPKTCTEFVEMAEVYAHYVLHGPKDQ